MTSASFIESEAHISDDGRYRYWLSRRWTAYQPTMIWVMLNPSTADAISNDPTIRKCRGFAERYHCGGIFVVNLFAIRSSDPKKILDVADPFGLYYGDGFRKAAALYREERHAGLPSKIVCAWGNLSPKLRNRLEDDPRYERARMTFLDAFPILSLGTTKAGEPRHPSRLGYDQALTQFRARGGTS